MNKLKLEGSTILAFVLLAVALLLGVQAIALAHPRNQWHCATEDEVVIINNTCVQIDAIHNESNHLKAADKY